MPLCNIALELAHQGSVTLAFQSAIDVRRDATNSERLKGMLDENNTACIALTAQGGSPLAVDVANHVGEVDPSSLSGHSVSLVSALFGAKYFLAGRSFDGAVIHWGKAAQSQHHTTPLNGVCSHEGAM